MVVVSIGSIILFEKKCAMDFWQKMLSDDVDVWSVRCLLANVADSTLLGFSVLNEGSSVPPMIGMELESIVWARLCDDDVYTICISFLCSSFVCFKKKKHKIQPTKQTNKHT